MNGTADSGDWFAAGIGNYMDNFMAAAEEALEEANKKLPVDTEGLWEIHDPEMQPDFLLDCPCGHTIEQDGTCHDGCVSPLRGAGMV